MYHIGEITCIPISFEIIAALVWHKWQRSIIIQMACALLQYKDAILPV